VIAKPARFVDVDARGGSARAGSPPELARSLFRSFAFVNGVAGVPV